MSKLGNLRGVTMDLQLFGRRVSRTREVCYDWQRSGDSKQFYWQCVAWWRDLSRVGALIAFQCKLSSVTSVTYMLGTIYRALHIGRLKSDRRNKTLRLFRSDV